MATFLSQHATTNLVFTHFFRNTADNSSDMATPFIVALLAQLFDSARSENRFSAVVGSILPLFDHFKNAAECPFHKLWPLVQMMFEEISTDFTLIVDALDECHDSDHFDNLFECLAQLSSLTNARIILLSRYHVTLNDSLAEAHKIAMDPTSVTPDISLYVKREIDRTSSLQSIRQQILTKAIDGSCGMFLWAKMMLDYLKRARSQNVQLHRLQQFPSGLARVYEQLLSENASILDQEELCLRRNIFLLLVGTCRPFTLEEISVLLALRCPSGLLDEKELLLDPAREVLRLCWPLAMIVDGSVQLIHMSVKEFLIDPPAEPGAARKAADLFSPHLTLRDSNAFLARKCLAKLCQDQYKAPGPIASLLRKNLTITSVSPEDAGPAYEAICYDYACFHWEVHLTAVINPAKGLLEAVGRFLTGYEFITWSEVRFRLDNEDLNAAINVRPNLESWLSLLPRNARGIISLSQYFDLRYTSLASFYNKEGGDRVLPLLCQARLGDYWSLTGAGDLNKGYRLLEIVADGFRNLLGERNPLSLKAECNLLIQYSWMNRWQEAYEGLSRIAQIQQDVVGVNIPDYYISLEYAAWATFSLTNLNDSVQGQARATAGLYQTAGPTDKEYLRSQMFQGWAQERRGLLDQAFYLYETRGKYGQR